jgi:hypothetical protein
MGDALQIERLYSRRRRLILRAERLERSAAESRAVVAQIEAELSSLVLFVPPMLQRKPNPHFKPGEMARRCRAVMREADRSVYVPEIIAALMKAKKLDHADLALRREIGKQIRNALFYMERRGTVVKAGSHYAARWELAG